MNWVLIVENQKNHINRGSDIFCFTFATLPIYIVFVASVVYDIYEKHP